MIKNHDVEVHYHPRKANVVADALSRKATCKHNEAHPTVRVLCCELNQTQANPNQFGALYISLLKIPFEIKW